MKNLKLRKITCFLFVLCFSHKITQPMWDQNPISLTPEIMLPLFLKAVISLDSLNKSGSHLECLEWPRTRANDLQYLPGSPFELCF